MAQVISLSIDLTKPVRVIQQPDGSIILSCFDVEGVQRKIPVLSKAIYVADLVIHPSKAETVDGASGVFDVSLFQEGNFFLAVTAKSGTDPNLVVDITTKDPVSGKWFSIATFTAATDVTSEMKPVADNMGRLIRAEWTITGTDPSFTFSVGVVLKTR